MPDRVRIESMDVSARGASGVTNERGPSRPQGHTDETASESAGVHSSSVSRVAAGTERSVPAAPAVPKARHA